MGRWRKERWEERERESTEKYQTYNSNSTETSAIQGSVSYLIFGPRTLPTPVHCRPIGGYLLDLSHQLKTHFHAQMKCVGRHYFHYCVFLFLFISPCIFIKRDDETEFLKQNDTNKHLDDKFTSSPFNPQPKTTTGLTGHTRVPGTVPQQRSNCNCMNSQ